MCAVCETFQCYRSAGTLPPLKPKYGYVIWVITVLVIKTASMSEVFSEKSTFVEKKLIYILAHNYSLY